MRFTRIPIIATLLAGALSLLFLLPAFGQTGGNLDRTEGRQRAGDLQVGVFESVGDAQVARKKRVSDDGNNPPATTRIFYVDADSGATDVSVALSGIPAQIDDVVATGVVEDTLRTADPAFLAQSRVTATTPDVPGNYVDTRNTTFNGTLYVGSKRKMEEGSSVYVGGYNAVLITLLYEDGAISGACDAVNPGDQPPAMNPYPVAQVSNPSRGYSINVPLALTATTEADVATTGDGVYLQAFFNVVDDTDPNLDDSERQVSGPGCWAYAGSGSDVFGQIAARHGDRLTIRIANQASNIALSVDAEGPEINLISPVDGSSVRPSSLNFRFDVQDSNSGLRHDGEYALSDDGDATSVNSVTDNDAVRGGEPRSVMTASLFGGGNGKAADIQAVFWPIGDGIGAAIPNAPVGERLTDANRDDDITDQGAWSIIGGRPGVGYSFSATGSNFDDAWNALQFTAMDRVGNTTTSDADLEKTGDQPFIFEVDDDEPEIGLVRTGISYDNSEDEEIVDRAAIALQFTEPIKSGDVVASRITVIGNSVVGVIQPDGAPIVFRGDDGAAEPKDCTLGDMIVDPNDPDEMIPNPNECPGADIAGEKIVDPRTLVFLQLGTALAADAEPDVSLLSGAVQDLAGNDIDTDTRKAEDWIAPTLMVTVTGTKGDRPIANDDGSFMVRVTSDENLRGRPRILFAEIEAEDNGVGIDPRYNYGIGPNLSSITSCNLTPEETDNAWSRSCAPDNNIVTGGENPDIPLTGLIAVYVLARDEDNSNLAVAPAKWDGLNEHRVRTDFQDIITDTLSVGDAVDAGELHDAGLLIEIDNIFNEDPDEPGTQKSPAESVTPQSGDDEKKTESANPFIHIEFEGEASEYGLGDYKDSHGTVTITEIKLNDEDATDQLSRVAKDEFSVVLRDLAVGKHTLTYKAEDDAGNEYNNGEFKFEVLQRKAYKVDVKPGWNLISLPGAPENTAIADVLSDTEFLTPVLAYQNGDWLTARRTDDNGWDGSLTDIEAGYGYWVHAQTFETISTLLTEIDPASVPPTVPVARGWNLLGVIDVDQRPAGDAPGSDAAAGGGEADNYFNSIPWKVAYSYDTQASVWQRYTPDDGDTDATDEILNGNGYWVWSERPSTLVP